MEGTFSCAFTRRDCTHDPTFRDAYQRTNRTRENKILRCFPHCCHGHLPRSYCGSSLHVQVDFHTHNSTLPSAPLHRQPQVDDDVFVFARFRPSDVWTLDVGDRIAADTVLSSLQSDANPAGEWIEGWLLASAHQNAWLFEVNRSVRWYYCWGSSAATAARNTDHLLEVFVFVRSLRPSGEENELEIVAKTCSPPFKLVSFRRAATVNTSVATATTTSTTSTSSAMLPSGSSASSSATMRGATSRAQAPFTASPKDKTGDPLGDLSTILSLAFATPLASLVDRMADHSRHYAAATASSLRGWTAPPPSSPLRDGRDLELERGYAQLLLDTGLYPGPSTGHIRIPKGYVDTAVEVAVWMSVDPEIHAEWLRVVRNASAHVSSKPRLLNAHSDWLVWLHGRVDAFLATKEHVYLPRWTLRLLVDEIHTKRSPSTPRSTVAQLGFPVFVAQVAQACVASNRRTAREGTESPLKRRRLNSSPPLLSSSVLREPSLPSLADLDLTAATARVWWRCSLDRIKIQPVKVSSSSAMLPSFWSPSSPMVPATLPLLLFFWRQLACISLTPSPTTKNGGDVPSTMVLRSALGGDGAGAGMPLVLDGRPHWSATLPNGDATLSTHPLGELRLGDYVAYLNQATGVLTVHWFGWQVKNAVWTGALGCRLRLSVADGSEMLAVATIESGSVAHQLFDEGMSASQRLARVDEWTPQWRAELRYEKLVTG